MTKRTGNIVYAIVYLVLACIGGAMAVLQATKSTPSLGWIGFDLLFVITNLAACNWFLKKVIDTKKRRGVR